MSETTTDGGAAVIELDSRRGRTWTQFDLVEHAETVLDTAQGILDEYDRCLAAYLTERGRARKLERDLLAERARSFPFATDDVLAALGRVYAGHPVSATEVAVGLGLEAPTLSQRIRAGQALSELSGRRMVVKHPAEYPQTHRWSLPLEGGDDA
jgi:hypothetical protein